MAVELVLEVPAVEVDSTLATGVGLGRRMLVEERMAVALVMLEVAWATSPEVV